MNHIGFVPVFALARGRRELGASIESFANDGRARARPRTRAFEGKTPDGRHLSARTVLSHAGSGTRGDAKTS